MQLISIEYGVIKLFSRATSAVSSRYGGTLDETDVRNVLSGKETLLDNEMCETIMQVSEAYANTLINMLRTNDIDLRINPVYFVGGGAILLKSFLENSGQIRKAEFVIDTLANAKGYKDLGRARMSKEQGN